MTRTFSFLDNIWGLKNLKHVEFQISIVRNSKLSSLNGLDSVDGLFSRLWKLSIYRNPLLTTCAVQSVCDYLGSGKWAEVFDNAPGCVDTTEIITDCQSIGIEEKEVDNLISLFPNPFSENVNVLLEKGDYFEILLFDSFGKLVLHKNKAAW